MPTFTRFSSNANNPACTYYSCCTLTLALTLLSCLPNLNAQVRYVNPDGVCGGNMPCHTTIQAAVNAASAGDVIYIADGTYNERVVIDKSLTLDGTSEAGTVLDGTGLVSPGSGIVINNGIENVTIRDLTVQDYLANAPNSYAGIYGIGGNDGLTVENVTLKDNNGGCGFYANGPVDDVLLNNLDVSGHTNVSGAARGIVIWNGLKSNITITNCTVYNNNCCGIELQNGSASGVTLSNNTVYNNGDNGIGIVGLDGSVGSNTISGNILTDNGRFGIEIKNPNGSTTVSGNTVSRTVAPVSANDLAGIAVMRRALTDNNVDVPTGVTVTGNTVSGYTQTSNSDGFGIVIGGTNHTVTGNTVTGNDVGIQQQAGHTPYPGDGDQNNLSDTYFGRDNSPIACGNTISGNTLSGNGVDTRDVVGPFGNGFVTNATSNKTFCSIQSAIDDAQTLSGHTLAIKSGNYTGTVDAATLAKNLTLAPGSSPGCVTVTGNMTLNSGDVLAMEANSAVACTGYDQFIVNGTVTLGGATLNLTLGYTPSGADAIMLINNDGGDAVTGTFAQGATITVPGAVFNINYAGGDGNDVVLTRQCADVFGSPVTFTGNVTLSTQAQVNAFKNGPGFKYTAITGNLTIDGNGNAGTAGDAAGLDPITNLCNLSELVSVTGNVIIRDFNVANNPTTLGDLAKLTTVGGSLTIGSTNANDNNLFTTVSLPALNAVGGTLTVNNNTVATTVSIPTAFIGASAAISVLNNADLQTLTLGVSSTTGNVTINTNGPDVAGITLSALTSVGGNLTLSNNVANATAADITLSALTNVTGNVNFTRTAKSLSASALATLGASSTLTFSTNALSPAGNLSLPLLGNVPGALTIDNNTGLNGISIPGPFSNPTASVTIDGNAGLQSVVLGVKSTTTDLIIQTNGSALTTLTLSNLMTVGRHLDMNNGNVANDVSGTAVVNLSALVSTGGRFRLVRAAKTLSIGSLTDVGTDIAQTVANRTFTFQRNGITDLDVTFPVLLNIGGNLSVTNNSSLSQCCIIPCKLLIGGPTTTVSGNTGNCTTFAIAQAACSAPAPLFLSITAPVSELACGEETEISVVATGGMTGIATLDYFVSWDPTKFELDEMSVIPIPLNGDTPDLTIETGTIHYLWPVDFATQPVTMSTPPDVTLLTFSLRALSCTSGSPAVYFNGNDPYYAPISSNFCFAEVPVTTTDLTLEVPDVTLSCPNNTMAASCLSQGDINIAFADWLLDVEYGGGCNPVLTRNPETPVAPPACGGVTTVIWSVTSDCGNTVSCTKTFTVTDAPEVELNGPDDLIEELAEAACQTQGAIDIKFAAWIAQFSHTGGCGTDDGFDGGTPTAPDACGGSTTVLYRVQSDCQADVTSTKTFTVNPAPDVTISCPADATEVACQTQEAIDDAFAAWLASFGFSGGCGADGAFDEVARPLTSGETNARPVDPVGPEAPPACGGSTTVTYRVTSECEDDATCVKTFTVTAAPDVTITCPADATVAACQIQDDVNTAFNAWLDGFDFAGGCNANGAFDGTPTAPSACGGFTTVTYRVTSTCEEEDVTCEKTFTVTAPPDVTTSCPNNTMAASCLSQDAINTAFSEWLDDFSFTGGCPDATADFDGTPEAPLACGGFVEVTYRVMSYCASDATCTKTFTVTPAPDVTLNCPADMTVAACQTQTAVDNAFADWLGSVSNSGGCNSVLTRDPVTPTAPLACGGFTTVTWTVTSDCEMPVICTKTFTVTADETNPTFPAPADVTLTTGAGASCPATADISLIEDHFNPVTASTFTVHGITQNTPTVYSDNCTLAEDLKLYVWNINLNVGGLAPCERKIRVTWRVYDVCGNFRAQNQDFLIQITPVVITCPVELTTTVDACQTQEDINVAFAAWLNGFSFTGGCDPVASFDGGTPTAPLACGGSVTATYRVHVSNSCQADQTCERTFTVTTAPDVSISCPADVTGEAACQTQEAIDLAFANWLSLFDFTGGCNGNGSFDEESRPGGINARVDIPIGPQAPDACGGSTTVTYRVTSDCEPDVTCSKTFTVTPAPDLTISCPADVTESSCQSQAAIDLAFSTWKSGFIFGGGCNATATDLSMTAAPAACGGAVTITYTATDLCGQVETCTKTFTVTACAFTGSIALTDPGTKCEGTSFNLTFAATGGTGPYTITVNGTDYTSVTDGGTISVTGTSLTTTYNLTKITDANGCMATGEPIDAEAVNLNVQPTMTVNALDSYCEGVTLTHSATISPMAPAHGAYGYTWQACASDNCTTCNTTGFSPNNTTAAPTRQWNSAAVRSVTLTLTTPGCPSVNDCEDFTIVTDPVAPTMAKVPDVSVACPDITLSVTPTAGTGGAGTCVDEYRYSTDNGSTWSEWSTTVPSFTSVNGTNIVESRRNCDAGGCNSNVNSVSWIVGDAINPSITCPDNVTVDTDPGICTASGVALGDPITSDNCSVAGTDNDATTTYDLGANTVTWTVTDGSGNTSACEQTVTVEDNEDPTITCPDDVTVDTDAGICTASGVALGTPTTSDNCSVAMYSPTNDAPMAYMLGGNTVTWTVTDGSGNTSACEQTVTVEDNEDPTITCPTDVTVGTDPGICTASSAALGDPTTSDNCSVAMGSPTNNAPMTYDLGANTVTWTVTDGSGNTSACEQTVTVEDTEDPTIDCPDDITVGACDAGAVDLGLPEASDNCSYDPPSNNAPMMSFPVGMTTTVTWTVYDAAGNSSMCMQSVIVQETLSASVSGDVTVCEGAGDQTITFTATGGSGTYIWYYNDPNGDPQTVSGMSPQTVSQSAATTGMYMYTLTGISDAYCEASASGTVTVNVNALPVLGAVLSSDVADESTTCPQATPITFSAGLTPAMPKSGAYGYTWGAYSNATATGSPAAGFSPNGTSNPVTRAFNSGNGPKSVRVTVTTPGCPSVTGFINWTQVADPTAGSTVIDVSDPTNTCPGVEHILTVSHPTPLLTIAGVTWSNAGSGTDNPYAVAPLTTSTYNVLVDFANWGCGDVNDAVTVTVSDTEDPTFTCPADVEVNTDEGICTASGVLLVDLVPFETVNDNCSVAGWGNDASEPYALGPNTVTWTVTDGSGNTATCEQTVTVVDIEKPMANCPPPMLMNPYNADLDECNATLSLPVSPTDNCGVLSTVYTIADVTISFPYDFPVGTSTVDVLVTDNSGNTSACAYSVTVEDNQNPAANCPPLLANPYGTDNNQCDATLSLPVMPTDNCSVMSTVYSVGGNPITFPYDFPTGTTTVGVLVTDNSGNQDDCSFDVTVEDDQNPTFPNSSVPDVTIHTAAENATCPTPADISLTVNQVTPVATGNGAFTFAVHGTTQNGPTVYSDNCSSGANLKLYVWAINNALVVNTCSRQIQVTWRVYDAAGNFRQQVQIYTIIDDKDPVFTACPANAIDLGCNPSLEIQPSESTAIFYAGEATDECGVTMSASGGMITGDCDKTQVWTVTATDPCGNSSECVVTFIWTEDLVAPVFDACPTMPISLGCNPIALPDEAMAIDDAGSVTEACTVAIEAIYDDITGTCNKTQVWTVTATDDCNESASCTVTYTWTEDLVGPTFASCPEAPIDLGCNPAFGLSEQPAVIGAIGMISDNCAPMGVEVTGGMTSGPACELARTWTATASDQCGNTSECTVTFIWQESTPVVLTCPANMTVSACLTQGAVDLAFSNWLANITVSGGCSAVLENDNTGAPSHTGGSTTVTFTVTSDCEDDVTCSRTFSVTSCRTIAGRLIWKGDGAQGVHDAYVPLVNMALVQVDIFDSTGYDGAYSLNAAPGVYAICPARDTTNLLNGLSALDYMAIQQHLTTPNKITDFYRFVAADCNNDNKITTGDASIIFQALMGSPGARNILRLTGSWRFIPTSFPAPLVFGPFNVPYYPRKDTVDVTLADSLAQNFYGVKTGDVVDVITGNANPHLKPDPDAKPLVWRVQDRMLKAGETVEIEFSAANFTSIAAFQHGMYFDPSVLQYEGAVGMNQQVVMTEEGNIGAYQAEQGELRTVWAVSEGITLEGVQPMYRLRFTTLKGGVKLSQVLSLNSDILEVVAFTDELVSREVQLVFADYKPGLPVFGEQVGVQNTSFDLLPNRPNPFSDRTTIGFILPEACDAQLRIFDLSGRELWRSDKSYPAGYHEEVIRLDALDSTGLLFYELTTPQGKQTRKMMAVRL